MLRMNCNDFELNVLRLARNDLIDAGTRRVWLDHTEACARCAYRLTEERALMACVHTVVAELAEESAPAHVGAALLTAFREHTPAVTGNAVIPMPRKVAWHWRLEATAAVILILISVLAVLWLYSRSPIEKHVAKVPPALVTTPGPSSPAVKPDSEFAGVPATKRPSRARHQAAQHNPNAGEEVTEYFPLMDGIDLDLLEAIQAVRVELPESALMDLGLRAGPEMSAGPVRADVLLGYDGLPRAIRFVR